MVRPRKDSSAPEARNRIIASFLKLLGTHRLSDISVGMIVTEANCNRGTFYYHFEDKEALVTTAIEEQIDLMPRLGFLFTSPLDEDALRKMDVDGHLKIMALLLRQGARAEVERQVHSKVTKIWLTVFAPDKNELQPATEAVLNYVVSGMMGLIGQLDSNESTKLIDALPPSFIQKVLNTALESACETQGVSYEETVLRLRMLSQFTKM